MLCINSKFVLEIGSVTQQWNNRNCNKQRKLLEQKCHHNNNYVYDNRGNRNTRLIKVSKFWIRPANSREVTNRLHCPRCSTCWYLCYWPRNNERWRWHQRNSYLERENVRNIADESAHFLLYSILIFAERGCRERRL